DAGGELPPGAEVPLAVLRDPGAEALAAVEEIDLRPEVEEPVGCRRPGQPPDVLGGALPREVPRGLPPLRGAVLVRGELVEDDRAPGAADRLAEGVPGDRAERGAGAGGRTARGRGPGGGLE